MSYSPPTERPNLPAAQNALTLALNLPIPPLLLLCLLLVFPPVLPSVGTTHIVYASLPVLSITLPDAPSPSYPLDSTLLEGMF